MCVPNGLNDFNRVYKEIYPECLVLEKTNVDRDRATFLDMDISVVDGKFCTKLYDKRRDFDFKVLSLPNLRSNVPQNRSYSVFYSQIFRLCNVNTDLDSFCSDVKLLKSKLVRQNFKSFVLDKYITKFVRADHPCIYKFWQVLNVNMFK